MNRNQKLLSGLVTAAVLLPVFAGTAQAATYKSSSDTGVNALDFVENEYRAARRNQLTDEQKQLLKDAQELSKHLRYPVDATQPSPVAFEGDDLTYDERTGDFVAKGKVNILQMDAHKFQGEEVTGNTVTHDIHVPDKAHVMQMTPGMQKVTLDGYKVNYNYMTKRGNMRDVTGKVDEKYVTGKRFEFYPDKVIIYNGTETKCSAKHPDYVYQADKITIIPDQATIMENLKVKIKGKTVYSNKHYVSKAGEEDQVMQYMPHVGYNSDDKAYAYWDLKQPIAPHYSTTERIMITGQDGWRSNYNLNYGNRHLWSSVTYGYNEDGDNKWIKKEPSWSIGYGRPIGKTHFNYGLHSEYGRWYQDGIHSNHWKYGVGISHDPIRFNGFSLYLSTAYNITRESYDKSKVKGWDFDSTLVKEFNNRWAAYAGYHYKKNNNQNSLFDYDTDDFSRKWEGGFSYRFSDKDRFVVGTKYDADNKEWDHVDYYWFHDMHDAEFILRYKSLTNSWHVEWDFMPW